MKKEIRNIPAPLSIRKTESGEESRRIEGYALVFNSRSEDLGGFTEIIDAQAMEGVLDRSDVLALLNHDEGRGVLARFRNGGGSLELTVDEKGLRYAFEAPNTALGEEVLEGVRRGDISGSSFAFTVDTEEWTDEGDGRYLRTIKRFGNLFDVSPVYHPAYSATSVDSRGLDAILRKKEEEECKSDDEEMKDEEDPEDDTREEDPDENTENPDESENKSEEENEEKEENNKRNNNLYHNKTMAKEKFSLLKLIRCKANGEAVDETTQRLLDAGSDALLRSGITVRGGFQIPVKRPEEFRFEDDPNGIIASQNPEAQTYGGENVPTDLFDLMGPLRDKLIVSRLGARMLSLTGNVEIPIYSGANCQWESEIGKAKDGSGKFRTVTMSPKRLTAELAISKQFLIQTDPSAEALIREDLVNCIAEKLQKTMFGDGAGDNVTPVGLFNGISADGSPFTYGTAVDMEAELEEANVFGEMKYVAAPSTKAKLRQTNIDKGSGRFVMENNEILGIPCETTSSVVQNGLILGNWSNFYIANFGALDLTIDPMTLASSAQIRLVVNAWFDYLVVRPEAFVKRIIA